MKSWKLTAADPGAYILAVDARFGSADYANDHIWEFLLSGGEPAALAIQTTFGLRARSLQIFPRFLEGDRALSDPRDFSNPPEVEQIYPNYLSCQYAPFTGIAVRSEYLVPNSQILAGRVRITNNRLAARKLRFELAAVLAPLDPGDRMAAHEMHAVTVLTGKTSDLVPVIFMTGGPSSSSGPYPALSIEMKLAPGATRQLTWVLATQTELDPAFEQARHFATQRWNAQVARLQVSNQALVEVETGIPAWDATFALAQKAAFNLFIGPGKALPAASFVLSRKPDQGYSLRGDGSDYSYLWNGQPVLESDYLASLILPAAPELARGLLENYLSTQDQAGFIDWKPGLNGQRSHLLATPLLVNLAWRIYQATEDRTFLAQVFPALVNFIQAWFSPAQDRDGDGIPEWAHVMQSGFEDQPTFSQWQPWAQGADITKAEGPALAAFLYHEIQLLLKIARLLERTEPVSALTSLADNLKAAVDAAWDAQVKIYRNWDRETHLSPDGELLAECQGSQQLDLQRKLAQPVRLSFRIETGDQRSRPAQITIHGHGASGQHRVEIIAENQFKWLLGRGNASSERVYSMVEYLTIAGLEAGDRVSIQVIDLGRLDQTLLLPLWAGIPDAQRAGQLVENTILDPQRFWKTFGIPACVHHSEDLPDDPCLDVHLPWNSLIGEGLLRYGYRAQAGELFTSLMNAVVHNLEKKKAFYHHYHAETGQGIGERNALSGIPPLGLFLQILGVRLINPKRVIIHGLNPFPWPVTLRYRGMTILCEKERTRVTFPGGQTAVVNSPEPRLVTLEHET